MYESQVPTQQKTQSRVPKYSDKFKDLLSKNQQQKVSKQKIQLDKYSNRFTQQQQDIQIKYEAHYQDASLIYKKQKNVNIYENQYKFIHQSLKEEKPQQFFFYRVKSIGVGAHSFVYLIQQQSTKFLYAQKAIIKTHAQKNVNQLQNQIKIQYQLNHDNLISLYHFYSDSSYIYLVMQYAEESLFSLKQKFTIFKEKEVIQIIRQLLHGIQYMHRKGYIHADLKLQNVMIRNGRLKICDFGYACQIQQHKKMDPNGIVGTLQYLSPQYVDGLDTGPLRDVWALGILCYELWTGKNPFQGLKQNQKWLKLAKPDYSQFMSELSRIQTEEERKSEKITRFISHTLCSYEQRYSTQRLLKFQFFNIVN